MSVLKEKPREWRDARRALERLAFAEFALASAVDPQGVRPMTREEARKRLFAEALAEMKHAAIFIRTPERMHPLGVKLYDGLIKRMDDFDREVGG